VKWEAEVVPVREKLRKLRFLLAQPEDRQGPIIYVEEFQMKGEVKGFSRYELVKGLWLLFEEHIARELGAVKLPVRITKCDVPLNTLREAFRYKREGSWIFSKKLT